MYHKTSIQRLSPAQISKLLNGHRVRVKHGHGHEVHLSSEQTKKLHAAHRRGAGITMEMDPYQIQAHQHLRHGHGEGEGMRRHHARHHLSHGEGGYLDLARNLAGTASKYAAPVVKQLAPVLIDLAAKTGKEYVSGHGEGVARRRGVRRGRGEGVKRKHGYGKKHYGSALYPAGYGEGAVGSAIGQALGATLFPF
jgi:hypothetical protein